MLFEHNNYREYLSSLLAERGKRNSGYSMRSFARDLGLQPSLLSEVLNGKRKLTEESALKIATKLQLEPSGREYLRLLVQLDRAKTPELRNAVLENIRVVHPRQGEVHDLSVDLFKSISDWHHFALLRLLDIADFEWSTKNAARALGVHEQEVEEALRRLQRLELILIDESGRPIKQADDFLVKSPLRNEALRKYHTQMLQKNVEALETQTPQERFTGTENVVLSEGQMAQAAEIFEDCFRRVLQLSQTKAGKRSEVYHVGIHMFRLTRIALSDKNQPLPTNRSHRKETRS